MNSSEYTPAAKALHWLIALLIFVLFPLGWVMDDLTGLQKFQAFNFHKSLGLTVLALMVLRLIWRVFNPVPELPASMPAVQKKAAHGLHHLLYLAIFVITLAGWATDFRFGQAIRVLPDDEHSLAALAERVCRPPTRRPTITFSRAFTASLAGSCWASIVLHIAGALYHGIVLKDGIYLLHEAELRQEAVRAGHRAAGVWRWRCLP